MLVGQLAARGHRLGRPDPGDPVAPQGRDGQQANRARPQHHRRLTQRRAGQRQRVQHHRHRLDQRALGDRQLGGQRQQVGHRQVHPIPEETRMSGRAQETQPPAEVVPALQALLAVITVVGRLEGGGVPELQPADPGPQLHHPPRRLVAQHHRVLAGRVAHAPLGVGVQIRSTDPHRLDGHLDLPRFRIGDLGLGQPELADPDELGHAHGRHLTHGRCGSAARCRRGRHLTRGNVRPARRRPPPPRRTAPR